MNSTTLDPPPRSAGIIPPGPHWYGIDDDANRPTGGIYSCTRDMSAYLRYALTHYNGLTHGAVNWFHPQSFADGSHSTYGMPWEILRTDKVLRGTTRPVTFVTKSGGVPGYASRITMSAEHGLGVTILVAGGSEFLEVAQELVTVPLVRAADRVALEQLQRYEGTYVAVGGSNADHEEALNTTLTVRNVKHTGLRITRFVSNGTDVLAGLRRVLGLRASTHLQLTPTLLYKNFERQAGEAWRAVAVEDPSDGPSGAVWDDLCITNVEYQDYAGVPFNELVFWMGLGEVRELELPGYRIKLRKVEHWDELREHANLASDGQQALVAPGAEV
ncbi:hypothetical protein FH972_026469 [Carpinus fangiana]|uniref:Beta-lactamase-like ARB-00930-like C-terminal domain-containing protein n=1 Tax=Carpinus fangiana TaxID=176857 RepID=A0A5N6L4D9_9ROSI|nr:hypothetical protein FH972_026469 [Carpinus fangiana]